jgi:hypothetical protein
VTDQTAEPCPGFPDNCPNPRTVEPNLVHGGGIRCGCSDTGKTIQGGVIMPSQLLGVSITAAKVQAPNIIIPSEDGSPLVTIRPDGRIEFGPAYEPDTAARAFWDALQHFAPTLDQRTGIRDVEAKLRAGAFRDGADRIRTTDLPDDYIDTFDAGVDWAANLMDQAAKEADPK